MTSVKPKWGGSLEVSRKTALMVGLFIAIPTTIVYYVIKRLRKNGLSSFIKSIQSFHAANSKTIIVHNQETLEEVVAMSKKFNLMSVDCEWVQKSHVHIALLQISFPCGKCFLINHRIGITKDLLDVFQDETIIKIGLGILEEDLKKFKLQWGIEPKGLVDLRALASTFKPNLQKLGLQGLVGAFLQDLKLDKDWRIRASNWEAEKLSERQVAYAANDALSAMAVLLTITLNQTDSSNFEDLVKKAYELCFVHRDKSFRKSKPHSTRKEDSSIVVKKQQKIYSHSTLKKPLYDNAKLEAPDGQLLCTCDSKKALWYVTKGLGTLVSKSTDENVIVRLNFEPSGRPSGQEDYYLTAKDNKCVVCGMTQNCLRKYIVPHEYRKFFPEAYRDHQSHDVLLMCLQCHQESNRHDQDLKKEFEQECQAPIKENGTISKEDFQLRSVKSAAKALLDDLKHNRIPEARKDELFKIVQDFYGEHDDVTVELLKKATALESRTLIRESPSHAEIVVSHFDRNNGILAFEKRWRKHFLDQMKPQFLPPNWSIDYHENRNIIKLQK